MQQGSSRTEEKSKQETTRCLLFLINLLFVAKQRAKAGPIRAVYAGPARIRAHGHSVHAANQHECRHRNQAFLSLINIIISRLFNLSLNSSL